MKPLKIVVLLSGNGSTFQAILDKCQREPGVIEIAAVISNKPNPYGLVRAQQAGVKTVVLEPRSFSDLMAYHQALQTCIDSLLPNPSDLIVLAGYMRILSPEFVNHFQHRILNIHPSLLPKFPGLHTHARAIEAREKEHGSSIHIVTAELDAGPIIAQAKVTVSPEDTPESLEQKVKALEQNLYPEMLFKIARGEIVINASSN
jgi:phosphoribosylglycinamide formyltransferase-1